MTLRIIYIASDGRSGSSLLESILSNAPNSISVGECFRFWERFYKADTRCGCGKRIESCNLWRNVDRDLQELRYSISQFKNSARYFLRYAQFRSLDTMDPQLVALFPIVKRFYSSIAQHSNSTVILDSSKSPSWAKLLTRIDGFDVRIIHLERSLAQVTRSWRRHVRLPEYTERDVWMPTKSRTMCTRTWLRVKILASRLASCSDYYFLRYERLCSETADVLRELGDFTGENYLNRDLHFLENHAIAGNPLRHERKLDPIKVTSRNLEYGGLADAALNLLDKTASLFW